MSLDSVLKKKKLNFVTSLLVPQVGLDFTPRFASTDEQKEEQRQVLIKQVELARRLDLPL